MAKELALKKTKYKKILYNKLDKNRNLIEGAVD